MVSPELLRRYPFFGSLTEAQLKALAMLAEETTANPGETLFANDEPAQALYVLLGGAIDLIYVVIDRDEPHIRKEFYVGEVNPGEVFGLSALVEPFRYTTTARPTAPSRLVRFPADELRALAAADTSLASALMRQVAGLTMQRLHATRVQLAAARA